MTFLADRLEIGTLTKEFFDEFVVRLTMSNGYFMIYLNILLREFLGTYSTTIVLSLSLRFAEFSRCISFFKHIILRTPTAKPTTNNRNDESMKTAISPLFIVLNL